MEKDSNTMPYNVPSGYFGSLGDRIIHGVKASVSIEDPAFTGIPHTAEKQGQDAYTVPEGYFGTLPEKIMAAIQDSFVSEDFLADNVGRNMPFEVPAHYFEENARRIEDQLFHSETDIADTTVLDMYAEAGVQPYQVPVGYFEHFKVRVLQDVDVAMTRSDSNVQGENTQQKIFRPFKWATTAAAAVVFMILGWGAYLMIGDSGSGRPDQDAMAHKGAGGVEAINGTAPAAIYKKSQLAALSDLDEVSTDVIREYLAAYDPEVDIYTEMDNYARSANSAENMTPGVLQNINKEDIEAFLEYEGLL